MSKLDDVKEVIKANILYADCGIFDCRNNCGDSMLVIYDEDGICVEICYHWSYFEVFGLSKEDFEELEKYYNKLRKERGL